MQWVGIQKIFISWIWKKQNWLDKVCNSIIIHILIFIWYALAPDVSNAFWTYLFDENSYENEQDSSEFGIPLTDLNDKAEERMMAAENIKGE